MVVPHDVNSVRLKRDCSHPGQGPDARLRTLGDGWVDAKGMFIAAAAAGPVYRLLGKKDMATVDFPPMETRLIDGDVAFRQHSGGHTLVPNWPTFITFASRYLKSPAAPTSQLSAAHDRQGN
jgi:hypothetical protein